MKLNRKGSIFALSILLILFLSIAIVSASEINTDDTDYQYDSDLMVSSDDIGDGLSDDVSSDEIDKDLSSEELSDSGSLQYSDEDKKLADGMGEGTIIDASYNHTCIGDSADISFSLVSNEGLISDSVDIYLNNVLFSTVMSSTETKTSVTITGLHTGSNTVVLNYKGGGNYLPCTSDFTITSYIPSKINFSLDEFIPYGSDVLINVELSDEDGTPITGIIFINVFAYDSEYSYSQYVISSGNITIHSTDLNVSSTYGVNFSFDGRGDYAPSTASSNFTVISNDTVIEIENMGRFLDVNDIKFNFSLYDSILKRIVGELNITVFDNESNIVYETLLNTSEEDSVSLNIGKLTGGIYNATVAYPGNGTYAGQIESFDFYVLRETVLRIHACDIYAGESTTVNFTLFSVDGIGLNDQIYFSLYDLNERKFSLPLNFTDGYASFELNDITGESLIVALYDGNDIFADSSSFATIRILKDVNGTIGFEADNGNVTVSLKDLDGNPIADAILEINDDGEKSKETTDENGQITLTDLKNNSEIEVRYTDAEGLVASNKIFVVLISNQTREESKITYKNMTVTTVDSIDGKIGKYFTATLTDSKGNPLVNRTVQIGVNGNVYTRTTNSTGGVKLQINIKNAGTYTFAVSFLGDDDYNGSFVVAKVTVKRQTPKITASAKTFKVSAKTKKITATFKNANKKAIKGKSLVFIINGKIYTATTNSKGVATVNVSLTKRGTYTCTIRSTEDNTYAATSTKITVKIT
ncbi:MAG: hypothetical protein IJP12_00820 [Methanobrevibacter sp.]|nr:hypothetical protein [Methanobrevibacter sp.]